MSQKSSALSILFEGGEGPLQLEFTNICRQKTTTSFVKLDRKGRREKKEILWPLAHNAKLEYTGRGACEEDGGGGGDSGSSFMQSLHEPGDM